MKGYARGGFSQYIKKIRFHQWCFMGYHNVKDIIEILKVGKPII